MSIKVSVIVPVYNVEEYLDECIKSVLCQTWTNIELLLIEDCSSDNSKEICIKYLDIDPRVKLIEHKSNMGLEDTRNDGINIASGQYIMFLDSDDVYELDAVEKMVELISKNNCDFAFSPYIRWQDNAKTIQKDEVVDGVYSRKQVAEMLFDQLPFPILSCVGSKIYSKDFLDKNHLRFEKEYKYNEDAAFIIHALMNSNRIYYFHYPFYNYRIRKTGSIQSTYRHDVFENISITDNLVRDFLIRNSAYQGNTKQGFLHKRLILILDSLLGEVLYKNYHSFLTKVSVIQSANDYQDILLAGGYTTKQRYVVFCLKHKLATILYISLKILVLFMGDRRRKHE